MKSKSNVDVDVLCVRTIGIKYKMTVSMDLVGGLPGDPLTEDLYASHKQHMSDVTFLPGHKSWSQYPLVFSFP